MTGDGIVVRRAVPRPGPGASACVHCGDRLVVADAYEVIVEFPRLGQVAFHTDCFQALVYALQMFDRAILRPGPARLN